MKSKRILILVIFLSCLSLSTQGMGFYASYKEYKRSYDIDYEDKSETLEGVDANENGMRDDLENFGKEALKDWDPLVLKAYHNWLRNLYIVMKKNAQVYNDTKIKYINSYACYRQLLEDELITNEAVRGRTKDVGAQISNLTYNTEKREKFKDKNWFLFQSYLIADGVVDLKYSCVDLKLSNDQLFLLQKRSITNFRGELDKRKDLTMSMFSEKPELYRNYIDFEYYKDKVLTRGEVYEEFYKRLDNPSK